MTDHKDFRERYPALIIPTEENILFARCGILWTNISYTNLSFSTTDQVCISLQWILI